MSEIKMKVIKEVEAELASMLSPEQVGAVSDVITKALAKYDVIELCRDLVPYDDVNERIMKQYRGCLYVDGKSKKTIQQYSRVCMRLADSIGKKFTDMGVYDIRYFLACEKENGLSNRSAENYRSYISAFFQWMTKEDIIKKNPCANIKPIKYTDVVRMPFSEVEIDALRSSCRNVKERAIMEVLLSSGVRVSELVSMSVSDIDPQSLAVRVRNGKGGKERVTFITSIAMRHVKEYLDTRKEDGTALFYNNNHQPIQDGGIQTMMKRIGERAKVSNVHPHRFRRTFASGLAARGMPVQEIQKLMGHSKVDTTMEYVYTSDEKVSASYRQYIA